MRTQNRSYGEGSIYQVSDTKWVAKISLGQDMYGKTKVKQFSGSTEAIVKKKLRDFKKSSDFYLKHIPSTTTIQNYFETWLKEYQYNKLKPLSYDRLESTVHNHIYPNMGRLAIDKVTRDNVQSLINQLYKEQELSYSSVKKVYVALNSCFKHAMLDDVITKNPCVGVILPSGSEKTKQITSFSIGDVERLKEELNKTTTHGKPMYQYGQAYLLILNTGMRMGEALSLCWSDVDFNNMTITVRKNIALSKRRDKAGNKTGGYELKMQESTKTSSGNRTIPINKSALSVLYKLRDGNNTPYVIVNSKQHNVLPSNFERCFHSVLKNANIEMCGVHVLRHTFASMMFGKGVDVKIISKLLGHSTVKITYDTYVHLFESDISKITCVLD